MNTSSVIIPVRFKVGYEAYSDYQVAEALNYVIREIGLALSSITSSLITTSATLTLTDNEADLPSDFENIIIVPSKTNIPISDDLDANTYQMIGNTIRCQGDTVKIYYKKSLPEYSYDGSVYEPTTIDLPGSFTNMIIDNVIATLTGQPTDIKAAAIKLVANRDGKKRPQNLIFKL
jgi:hypothetical protein